MKTLFTGFLVLFLACTALAQTTKHQVNGESLDLQTAVEGPLTLRWNTFDTYYRYFAEKDGVLSELLNTKGSNGYNEEYLQTLKELTADQNFPITNVRLTLGSLRTYFNAYNEKADPNFVIQPYASKPEFRLGGFGGVTNSSFVTNPNKSGSLQFGIDFEILDPQSLPRHAVVVQFKQTLSSDDFDYNASQFSLNYRFKFVKSEKIDVFVNSQLLTFTSFKRGDIMVIGPTDSLITIEGDSGSSFQAPLLFGLGADIKVGKGYLTFGYYNALGIFIDNNGEFPVDVVLGYKFVL